MTEHNKAVREVWKEMDPELGKFLSDLAFSSAGEALTPQMRDAIEDNAIQDITEDEQGES